MIVLKIILIILAVIISLAALLLWSTITIDLASNGDKTIIEFRLWRFIKYTINLPDSNDEDELEENELDIDDFEDDELNSSKLGRIFTKHEKKSKYTKQDEDDESLIDRIKKEFLSDLKGLWDSEYNYFDFDAVNDMIDKYGKKIDTIKYGVWRFFSHMKKKIRITKFDLLIKFGTGKPDRTGTLYGASYGFFGALQPLFLKWFNMKTIPRLYLEPDYVNAVFGFEVGIIIKTRAAHILNAAIVGFVSYILRKRKGSVENVTTIRQASN